MQTQVLSAFFKMHDEIELALLVGSRATGKSREHSDWDFAIQWNKSIPYLDTLGKTESLRADLARLLNTSQEQIDIIDMPGTRLAMRAAIAREGKLLKGDNSLAWSHFLLRTWRDLETFEWEQRHAA